MAEELEIIEGAELTEEEKAEGVMHVALDEADTAVAEGRVELNDDELEATAGGASKITVYNYQKKYCPWCNAYESVGNCGRVTGKFGQYNLTNMPLFWCRSVHRYFLGPSAKGRYYAWDGHIIK